MPKIYYSKTDDLIDIDFDLALKLMPEANRCHILKFADTSDRKRAVCSFLLKRVIYRKFLNSDFHELKFNAFGKPYLADIDDLFFNISHSGDWIVCAVSNSDIGVDIEEVKKINIFDVAKIVFTASERHYIDSSDDPESAFYSLWTAKESCIKALGLGFSADPQKIEINLTEGSVTSIYQKLSNYFVENIDTKMPEINSNAVNKYKVAVCATDTNSINCSRIYLSCSIDDNKV